LWLLMLSTGAPASATDIVNASATDPNNSFEDMATS
jgi:hypothetical protein